MLLETANMEAAAAAEEAATGEKDERMGSFESEVNAKLD